MCVNVSFLSRLLVETDLFLLLFPIDKRKQENGVLPPTSEPHAIAKVHAEEVKFVKQWMKEWHEKGRWKWKLSSVLSDGEIDVGRWV